MKLRFRHIVTMLQASVAACVSLLPGNRQTDLVGTQEWSQQLWSLSIQLEYLACPSDVMALCCWTSEVCICIQELLHKANMSAELHQGKMALVALVHNNFLVWTSRQYAAVIREKDVAGQHSFHDISSINLQYTILNASSGAQVQWD
jgi:hypothetical protein